MFCLELESDIQRPNNEFGKATINFVILTIKTPRSWLLYCWNGEAEPVYTLSSEKVIRFGSHRYEARLIEKFVLIT